MRNKEIEQLLKADLNKIENEALRNAVQGLVDDYKKAKNKPVFEKEEKESIQKLLDFIQKKSPNALKAGSSQKPGDTKHDDSSRIQGKNRNTLLDHHNALLDIAGDYHGEKSGDLEGFFENALSSLNEIIEESKDSEIPSLVKKAVKPFYAHAEKLEGNQKLRFGTVNQTDVKYRNKAVKIVDDLLDALESKPKGGEPAKEASNKANPSGNQNLRSITEDAVAILTDLSIDLEGEEETIIATTILDFEQALEQKDDLAFIKEVKKAVAGHEDWADDIQDKKLLKAVDEQIKKIKNALLKIDKDKEKSVEKSTAIKKKMAVYQQDIEACRAVIREHNKKKRESQPPKRKKTRYTLLKEKLLGIEKLTPDQLKSEDAVIERNRKILKETARKLMENWGMNQFKNMEKAIDEKFDDIEEKIEVKEQKELADRWKQDLPHTDKVIAFEKRHNKHLLEEAALLIVDHITEAIKRYKSDKEKAFHYLNEHFEPHQLEVYLPGYILEEMTSKPKETR